MTAAAGPGAAFLVWHQAGRIAPALPADWPARPYRPGQQGSPRPESDLERFRCAPDGDWLQRRQAFDIGLAAARAGYFWEAHEIWESVWLTLPPASAERLLLAALIQLANAGLKRRMDQPAAARRIAERARGLLAESRLRGARHPASLDPRTLEDLCHAAGVCAL